MNKILYTIALLAINLLIFTGCSKEEEQLFDGADNGLTSFAITANGITYQAAIQGNEIILSAPIGLDLSTSEAKYELCENASIVPDPKTITNWGSQHVFRVKSHSKTPREYTYTVSRSDVSQTGNVQLISQTDVDNFAKLGVTLIDGNLVIGSDSKPIQDSIVDLESLASLKEVRYNIIINRSFTGGSLKGLENIERCGGLHIGRVASPIEFSALSGLAIDMPLLRSVGDVVLNSSSIKSLSFAKLESVSSLYIASNSVIAIKLPMLKESVGSLSLENHSGSINSILPDISLPSLEKVGGTLSLQWFTGVAILNLSRLHYLGGDLDMGLSAGSLEEINFPELTTVGGSLIIEHAPGTLKFSAPKVTQLVSFIYNRDSYGNFPLMQLDLPLLHTIEENIYIRGIPIEELTLPKLKEVGGEITFWDLKMATNITLPTIKKVGTKIQLYSTALLKTFDISNLDNLTKFEIIGCASLNTVKSPSRIVNLTINYASKTESVTPVFEGLVSVDGELNFTSDNGVKVYEIRNIKTINALRLGGGAAGAVLNLYDTEKINTFELSSQNMVTINAPKLVEVENLKFSYISKLTNLNIPLLKTVGTFTLSEHNVWNSSTARMTDLELYKSITKIGTVTISNCAKLMDFSAFAGIISTLSAEKWSVTNCEYNPSFQDMMEGKYVKP